ncbi:tyrosine--trna ligase, chloroplasticmitochondrial [Nicotiana attenuata]|uniref:Tyrosine--tRNA ligase n=1 Tax=Nicotiana attenuata TaxID=49451 RepID=A0A314L2G3_NICAT|nr:tyrosine--trna ligase, chloroplasticmitochondrial [Nicotiana attenuata]
MVAAGAINSSLRTFLFNTTTQSPFAPSFFTKLSLPTCLFLPNNHKFSHRPFCYSSTQLISQENRRTEKLQNPNEKTGPNVLQILEERGLLESVTSDSLRSVCSDPNLGPLKVYCGFDPTAESLHLGNLLGIIVLSWFLRCGHNAVALIGGATGRIGDPSGKSLERPELDLVTLEKNISGIGGIIKKILVCPPDVCEDAGEVKILNNYDWWKDVKFLDFLRNVGRYARVGTMMSKESVKKRLENAEQGMSYAEFTYQLLQGYDFVHLYEKEGVSVQIGGSDQWGNITAGTDLIRRLIGKSSENGTVVGSVPRGYGKNRDMVPNTAQRRLAEEVTRFVHGQEGLEEALKATEALKPGNADTKLDWKTIEGIAADVPSCSMNYDQVLNIPILDLYVSSGLLESKSAARRMLKQGGLYLNNAKVDGESKKIEADDIVDDKVILLSAGKKNKMVVRIS